VNGLLYASLHVLADTDITVDSEYGSVRVGRYGHDLTLFGDPDDLTRLAVALLAAATPREDTT
jgi:hypothetical protein